MHWRTCDSEKLGKSFVKRSVFANSPSCVESPRVGVGVEAQAKWKLLLCDLGLAFSLLGVSAFHCTLQGGRLASPEVSAVGLGFSLPARHSCSQL